MWEFLHTYGPRLVDGALVTCAQFALATLVACSAALVAGLGRLSALWPLRTLATLYIEIFRGTSLLVQLYWIFFVLPLFGVSLPKFEAGFLSVGLNVGAYGAEIVRGAITAVPRGQWEAGYALSMSPARRMRRIILPQALVLMLPPWGNLLIELLKGTALVALIAVPDLMFVAKQINGATFRSAEAFGAALLIYYLLARLLVTPAMRGLERVMARRLGRA
jgi:polar amino acid transport system permease protein